MFPMINTKKSKCEKRKICDGSLPTLIFTKYDIEENIKRMSIAYEKKDLSHDLMQVSFIDE